MTDKEQSNDGVASTLNLKKLTLLENSFPIHMLQRGKMHHPLLLEMRDIMALFVSTSMRCTSLK